MPKRKIIALELHEGRVWYLLGDLVSEEYFEIDPTTFCNLLLASKSDDFLKNILENFSENSWKTPGVSFQNLSVHPVNRRMKD